MLRMTEERILKKVPRRKQRSRWEQQVRKDITQKEAGTWEKIEEEELWEDTGREAWLSDDKV
jgi:hypothetical protein